jgi:uncharacterized protein
MPVEVAETIANYIRTSYSSYKRKVNVIWHGGEPLSTGIQHFRSLLSPFATLRQEGIVVHDIQTNGTLINPEWCTLFREENINVGVSIDGPKQLTIRRVNWQGKEMFQRILGGIEMLKQNGIPFNIISVVSKVHIDRVSEFYNFFCDLGCDVLNINIEEAEGLNRDCDTLTYDQAFEFWYALFELWLNNPKIRIREFDKCLRWVNATLFPEEAKSKNSRRLTNIWPTFAYNGDYCILSPELLSLADRDFILGNAREGDFLERVQNAYEIEYLRLYEEGRQNCANTCSYYSFCGGGFASNKYIELGDMRGTETKNCINTKKALVDAVLKVLKNRGQTDS